MAPRHPVCIAGDRGLSVSILTLSMLTCEYTLQHTATHCNTLQHRVYSVWVCSLVSTHCNTLQHTATHCNTLQHTATQSILTLSMLTCEYTYVAPWRLSPAIHTGYSHTQSECTHFAPCHTHTHSAPCHTPTRHVSYKQYKRKSFLSDATKIIRRVQDGEDS